MPEIAGHELPTPSNADSPKQRKHREQAIVIGTLVLIILTYMLVMRNGSNASPDTGMLSDASGFQPTDAGAGGGDQSALPGMIGGIPGQVAALEQGNTNRTRKQIARLRQRVRNTNKRLSRSQKTNHRQTKQIHHLQQEVHHLHPQAPKHPIHVTHRAPHHAQHPPTHAHGKKTTIQFGNLTNLKQRA